MRKKHPLSDPIWYEAEFCFAGAEWLRNYHHHETIDSLLEFAHYFYHDMQRHFYRLRIVRNGEVVIDEFDYPPPT
jgi:hypothetical protein